MPATRQLRPQSYALCLLAVVLCACATPLAAQKPVFSKHPNNITVNPGDPAVFSVAAVGPAVAYQWQCTAPLPAHAVGVTPEWVNIPNAPGVTGATSGTLTITEARSALHNYQFRCVASNTHGVINGSPAILRINPVLTITRHPVDASVPALTGQTATFTIAATGDPAPQSYAWQYSINGATWDDLENGAVTLSGVQVAYSGVNTPALTIYNVPPFFHNLKFRCRVRSVTITRHSDAATLVIVQPENPKPK